jgi:hypothetical protein
LPVVRGGAAKEDAAEVCGGDVVAERRGVELAELGDRERFRCERGADVRVGEFGADAARVRRARSACDRRRAGEADRPDGGVGVAGNESEVGGCEFPA